MKKKYGESRKLYRGRHKLLGYVHVTYASSPEQAIELISGQMGWRKADIQIYRRWSKRDVPR